MVVNKFAWSQKPETYFPNVYGAWWQDQQMASELRGLHTAFTMAPWGLSSGLTKGAGTAVEPAEPTRGGLPLFLGKAWCVRVCSL